MPFQLRAIEQNRTFYLAKGCWLEDPWRLNVNTVMHSLFSPHASLLWFNDLASEDFFLWALPSGKTTLYSSLYGAEGLWVVLSLSPVKWNHEWWRLIHALLEIGLKSWHFQSDWVADPVPFFPTQSMHKRLFHQAQDRGFPPDDPFFKN